MIQLAWVIVVLSLSAVSIALLGLYVQLAALDQSVKELEERVDALFSDQPAIQTSEPGDEK